MRKRTLLIFLILMSIYTIVSSESIAEKWSSHWVYQDLVKAIEQQTIDYNENYDLEQSVTRLEFIKALQKTLKILPDSSIANLYQNSYGDKIQTGDQWIDLAFNFGMLQKGDYDDGFKSSEPITRREAIMITARALGFTNPATQFNSSESFFVDWNSVPSWAKGLSYEMKKESVLLGYPNGSVKLDRLLTKAESIAITQRTEKYNKEGANKDTKLIVKVGDNSLEVKPIVPIQFIGEAIYVPVRTVFGAGREIKDYYTNKDAKDVTEHMLNNQVHWYSDSQAIFFLYGVNFKFEPNKNTYLFHNTMDQALKYPPRLQSGEVMIPLIQGVKLHDLGYMQYVFGVEKDEDKNEVIVTLSNPNSPYN